MPYRSINVTQPHSLGIEVAKQRLRAMVDQRKDSNPHIVPGDFSWQQSTNTFTLDCTAFGTPVHTLIHIEADKVSVVSDTIDGVFAIVWFAVAEAEREIGNMLREALK